MRSILIKISLWFFATLVGTLVAFYVIAFLITPGPPRPHDMFARTLSSQVEEARFVRRTREIRDIHILCLAEMRPRAQLRPGL